jgi:hypothetical protein
MTTERPTTATRTGIATRASVAAERPCATQSLDFAGPARRSALPPGDAPARTVAAQAVLQAMARVAGAALGTPD